MRRSVALPVAAALALVLAGCSGPAAQQSQSPAPTASALGQGTFVVAASVDPLALDPAVVTDPDSLRVTRQVFETLVALPAGSADPAAATPTPGPVEVAPLLATTWEVSADSRSYTLVLREGVEFHDGTPFDAAAVCANVDRWYTFDGRARDVDVSGAYQEVFGGFIDQPEARYAGCTQLGPLRVRLDLAAPAPGLLTDLTRPQFAIQSPTAMAAHGAYATGDDPRGTSYATAHPTGTGPFRFGAWEPGVQVVLLRNADYWGSAPAVERVLVRTINDPQARAEQLLKGEIDAYDQVTALDAALLDAAQLAGEPDGLRVERRAVGDLAYLGIDQRSTVLDDPRLRQAVAAAIDPQALVAATMPTGSTVADRLRPGEQGARAHPYDPVLARGLLAEAGATDLTVRIAYPSGVQQSGLPAPEQLYVAVAQQLAAVGITAEPVAMSWPAFLAALGSAESPADLHLMGVSMASPDSGTVITQLLTGAHSEFGIEPSSARVAALLSAPAGAARAAALASVEQQLLDDATIVPIAYPASSVVFGPRVVEAPVSPYGGEVWTAVRVSG